MDGERGKKRPKEQSAGAIVEELRKGGSKTKQDIASYLKLSFSSISMLCRSLEDSGYILVEEGVESTGGRRPNNVRLNPDAGSFAILTFSFPTDVFKLELLDFTAEIVGSKKVAYDGLISLESLIDRIRECLLDVFKDTGRDRERLLGVCLAIPGVFDKRRGITFTQGKNLLDHVCLRDRLHEALKTQVVIENDANLVALGYGTEAGGGARDMLMLYFTHGIGMGILNDGRIMTGRAGYAGEVGHIHSVEGVSKCDFCGMTGCVQTVATLRYMLFEYHEGRIAMKEILERQDELSAGYLAALERGDTRAVNILNRAGKAIGDIIGSLIDLFNPEIVGISGYDIGYLQACIETIRVAARERSYIIEDNDTPITVVGQHERLMTKGAAESIFEEWLSSANLIGSA